LELFFQDIQSFELKEKDSVRIIKMEILLESSSNKLLVVLTRLGLVFLNAARPVSTAVPHTTVNRSPRPVKHVVHKSHSPIKRPINHRPTSKPSNFNQQVTTVKIQVNHGLGPQKTLSFLFDEQGNPQQALKDKGVIDNGCSRHMTGNISYLLDFESFNEGYVAFGGNPKGGKILDTECVVLSFDFKLPDENHVLHRLQERTTCTMLT
nr:hypothetical protein [Tanacetum cinerariifolium]